ncbi:TonB-dependent receptor domain-containing protein [Kineobactrum salinum]|uniref:TonB-dependent receptor n=1 Tax=Kineobactrum salinum TaxID=2708301 RepID=A0A6C0TYU1_9GAMM|nr:TonB-dependent receptor [Kineobactrum salinum]QIB64539.1 TonB-dependent receptor [Kineobactrum salinum]
MWGRAAILALLISGVPAPQGMAAGEPRQDLAIAAGSLERALLAIARQTGVQIIFSSELVQDLASPSLQGQYSLDSALQAALEGSGLVARRVARQVVVIEPRAAIVIDGESESEPEPEPTAVAAVTREEVIVTASRRPGRMQSTPIGLSVLTNAGLERRGADGVADFGRLLPGVMLFQANRNRGVFTIRGIATNVFGSNSQDPVSVYLNETPLVDSFGAVVQPDLRLFDIARVEVLRGPQGTLFGSGALGGTVRIITNKPDAGAPDALARVDLGHTRGGGWRQRYDAMVNLPLVADELALRLVGYYRDEAGWVRNIRLGTDNSTRDWGGRAALRWQPGERLALNLELVHQDSQPQDGDSWDPSLGRFSKSSLIPEARPSTLSNYHLAIDYEIPGLASLLSATSYQESGTAVYTQGSSLSGLDVPLLAEHDPWRTRFFTQEFRLVGDHHPQLDWVAGAAFVDRRSLVHFNIRLPGLARELGRALPTENLISSVIRQQSRELAVFGDLGYQLTQRWRLFAGARVFDTRVHYREPRRQVLDLDGLALQELALANDNRDNGLTWRAGLSFAPAANIMLYGSISKGYRIGQVNPNQAAAGGSPPGQEIPEGYEPDTTLNYEIGLKSGWFNQRLLLNLAAYHIDWDNIQIDASRPSDGLSFVTNAGRAVSRGLELELATKPAPGFSADLAVTLQDASIQSIGLGDGLRSGARAGDTLPGSADFKVAGSLQYEWQSGHGRQLYARLDAQYVGASPAWFSDSAGSAAPAGGTPPRNAAYSNVNLGLGIVARHWQLGFYIENLINNDDQLLRNRYAGGSRVNSLRPRTIGTRLKFFY